MLQEYEIIIENSFGITTFKILKGLILQTQNSIDIQCTKDPSNLIPHTIIIYYLYYALFSKKKSYRKNLYSDLIVIHSIKTKRSAKP